MLFVATSREIGEKCKAVCPYPLVSMDEAEIFVSVMYDTLIPPEYIKGRKCFNFHPGILPDYRGAGAYSWAIINGEKQAGVTLHEIDRDIDHGDIIDIWKFDISESDTAETLFKKAEQVMLGMFTYWLPRLIAGDYETRRVGEGRIYYRKDLEKAKDLTRFKRAFTFEGKESAYYYDNGIKKYL